LSVVLGAGFGPAMNLVLQSSVAASYNDALERLVFFNTNQLQAQADIVRAVEQYGVPAIVSGPEGLHVSLSQCDDAQCLFALVPRRGRLELAGMLIYRRTCVEEVLVVHIAVADRYGRTKRPGLGLVIGMLRAVRAAARRLRGVQRVRLLYRDGRQFGIPISRPASRAAAEETLAHPR